jgi:hypothetical protein
MIIALLNKGLLFALLYFLYKAYKASSGIGDLIGDVPQTLAVAALLVAVCLLSLVALLRCGVALQALQARTPHACSSLVIFLWPRKKSSAPASPIPTDFSPLIPPLPLPVSPHASVLIVGYGASAQALWSARASLFSSARWACPVQYEQLLRSRGAAFVEGIT